VERSINGPDRDYLTEQEAADWLRLDAEDFHEFVRMGLLPKGIAYGKTSKKHRWHWMDVIAAGHLLARGFIKLPGVEE
jgi:hypothetical protein